MPETSYPAAALPLFSTRVTVAVPTLSPLPTFRVPATTLATWTLTGAGSVVVVVVVAVVVDVVVVVVVDVVVVVGVVVGVVVVVVVGSSVKSKDLITSSAS